MNLFEKGAATMFTIAVMTIATAGLATAGGGLAGCKADASEACGNDDECWLQYFTDHCLDKLGQTPNGLDPYSPPADMEFKMRQRTGISGLRSRPMAPSPLFMSRPKTSRSF